MSINTGLQIPYGIQPTNPLPVDAWSGPFIAGSLNAGISAANSAIPIAFRFQSMEVRLIVAGESYKYWYAGGTGDGALVPFSAPGTPGPTGDTPTDYVSSFNGVTGAVTGITAGGTNTFTQLNTFSAGISASGATFNGTVNIGTTALISAPSATALAIRSQIPAGTGVTPTIQIICPSAGYTLTNQIATQKVFDLPQDTITLQAATTYMFEGHYLLTTGTTSHTTSMSFVLTTATITNCTWTTFTTMPSALNTTVAGNATAIFNSVTGGVVNGSSANPNTMITFKGIMRVNAGGTMVPNIAFSAQPGGTNNVLIGSYLKFYPIGSNTIDFVGTAIG